MTVIARSAARTGALHLRLRHPHYLIGDAIGFDLVGVARLVDRELGLQSAEGAVPDKLVNAQGGRLRCRMAGNRRALRAARRHRVLVCHTTRSAASASVCGTAMIRSTS